MCLQHSAQVQVCPQEAAVARLTSLTLTVLQEQQSVRHSRALLMLALHWLLTTLYAAACDSPTQVGHVNGTVGQKAPSRAMPSGQLLPHPYCTT